MSFIDADEIAWEIRRVAQESVSEEDLKQGVEYIIRRMVIERIKEAEKTEIPYASWRPPRARYEVTLISGLRLDALYGHLIIEYEKPKTFETRSGFEKAVEQVKRYIRDHAEVEARFPRYFGVVLDGYKIGFVRYREAVKGFESKGPFEVNRNTVAKLIEAIIGLRRKALSAEELLKDFGPESQVAEESIKTLYGKLLRTSPRTKTLFDDWRRVFSQVCAYSPEKIRGLEEIYGFRKGEADPEKLLFSLHTYYALIMKLLAAEVASLYVTPRLWSYLKALEDSYYLGHERLREELRRLEEGGIFAELKIMNFMEADYFAWYLDEWDEDVARCIMNIINRLSNYDPSAAELEPERIRDLFKRLYQNLVPKKIRHDLGEYYTPDWLAELVLNEAGWTMESFEKVREEGNDVLAPLNLRLLDPACGSGTFPILAISRLRQYVEEHWIDKGTALRRITKNIVGFDLNPLAVIASRANYLIALGDMLREKGAEPMEIPVYLADSILVRRKQTLTGAAYILKTVTGDFIIPISIVERGLLARVLTIMEECVKGNYKTSEFRARLSKEVNLKDDELSALTQLFETLLRLEWEGKNRIWTRILKNSFAPLFAGKFDYVVGNPPWVNWENLPEDYRKASNELWEKYGLKAKATAEQFELGKMKRDISMLFLYVCVDRYLINHGMLGFLITQMVFKTKGAEVFRKFKLPDGVGIKALKVHDMVYLKPFEEAANMTSMIILKKGADTEYPIPYIRWTKIKKGDLTNATLEDVLRICSQEKLIAVPIDIKDNTSQWLTVNKKVLSALDKIKGTSYYRPHLGVNTGGANGVYWIKIIDKDSSGNLLIENLHDAGKRKLKKVITFIEPKHVFKLIRSGDLDRWLPTPTNYIIVPHTEQTDWQAIPEHKLKVESPKTYEYLLQFKEILLKRSAYTLLRKGHPFYIMVDIRKNSFAPYKVAWKRMGDKINASVLSLMEDKYIGKKPVIPQETISFIPLEREDEAHYLCSVLNSSEVTFLVKSFSQLGGKSFATPSILEQINIPKYDPENPIHQKLAQLSKKAHQLAQHGQEAELRKVEEEIDRIVAQLYGITEDELKEVKRNLAMLEGKEFEVDVEEATELPLNMPDISLRNNVVCEGKPFNVEVVVSNPLDKPLTNVSVKLKLFDGRFVEKGFESVEGGASFPLSFDGLKAGEHKVEAVFSYVFENTPKRVEKELTIYVKGFEVKHVERRFKPEDIFGV
jgi:methylase of polypeptide subunit release factors